MLSQSELKLLMSYDPVTGILTWNRRPEITAGDKGFNSRCAGKPVGTTKNSTGYVNVHLGRVTYTAHRLIWLYVHGYLPDLIDHIDQDKTHNQISNLRPVTKAQNNFNRKHRPFAGVVKMPNGRWRAAITINGRKFHLGVFDHREGAARSYAAAAASNYGMNPVYQEAAE